MVLAVALAAAALVVAGRGSSNAIDGRAQCNEEVRVCPHSSEYTQE